MAKGKKKNKEEFKCIHSSDTEYNTILPNQHLKPIDGRNITWHIDESSLTADMEKYKTIFAFEQVFRKWEEVLYPIVFKPVGSVNEAQIVIKFKSNGDSDLPIPFGSTTLAYAFAPNSTSLGIHADMYFNDAYKWDEVHKPGSIYLFKVAVHELGHSLNLGHQTADKSDIMYPIYQPNGDVILNNDTRKGIYDLYRPYGVRYTPVGGSPENQGTQELRSFIKTMYRSNGDLARLTANQLNSFGAMMGLTFTNSDKPQRRIDLLWNVISTF